MKVLLVWEEIPEEIILYLFDNPSDELLGHLEKAHTTYINTRSENESTLWLDEYIRSDKGKASKVNFKSPLTADISKVFISGFYL